MLRIFKYIDSDGQSKLNSRGLVRVFLMLIKGGAISLRLCRPVLLGRGARIEHAGFLRGRGVLKAEEHATVQGISTLGVTIGRSVSLGAFSQLRPSSQYGGLLGDGCVIGDGTTFGPFCYIGCAGFIEIGSNCMFGPRVSLIAENHLIPTQGNPLKGAGISRKGIKIGDDCWVGANVVVLDGSNIGSGSVIGAGAVVSGVIPPNSIAVGIPARVVKKR